MEEEEKRVVVRENPYRKPYTQKLKDILLVVLTLFIALICLFLLITTGELILLLPMLGIPGVCIAILIGEKVLGKSTREYVFTPAYFVPVKNGKEGVRVYWETVGGLRVEESIGDMLRGVKPLLTFDAETVRDGKFDIQTYCINCSEEELSSVQEVIPVMISDGRYCSTAKKEEIKSLRERITEHKENPFFYVSVRGRAAYLICCLENALLQFGRIEEWRERLKTLWLFTSCIGNEREKSSWEEAIGKYRAEYEAFPELTESRTENLITFEEWRELVRKPFLRADEAGEEDMENYILDRILQTIYRVSAHTPDRDSYAYDSAHCCAVLDEATKLSEVLQRYNIPLPMPKFYPMQTYMLYSDGTRDPFYGIGLPFNGLVMYSVLGEEARKECAPADRHILSPGEEYEALNEMLAPVLSAEETEDAPLSLRTPKYIWTYLIMGAVLFLFSLGAYIIKLIYAVNGPEIICLLFGLSGNIFVNLGFLLKRLLYERNQPYPLKWLDTILLLGMGVINTVLAVNTLIRFDDMAVFGGLFIALFMASGAAYFAQWIELFAVRGRRWKIFGTEGNYDGEEWRTETIVRQTFGEICGAVLAILSLVFFSMYYAQTANFFLFAILSIMTGSTGVLLLNRAVTSAKYRINTRNKIILWIMIPVLLAASGVAGFMEGMRTGEILPIDVAVILFLVAQTVFYIVLLIRMFINRNKYTEE